MSEHAPHSPFSDLDGYVALPRLGALSLSPDGRQLVVEVSAPNREGTAYTSALWALDPAGQAPARRLTRSPEGERVVTWHGDELLFTSGRPVPASEGLDPSESTKALWCLPAHGEAHPALARDGGVAFADVAKRGDVALLGVPVHAGAADDEADARLRKQRREGKVSAILHGTAGVRHWDHDLGAEHVRLRVGRIRDGVVEDVRDLTGDEGRGIAAARISDDGQRVVVEWRRFEPLGRFRTDLVVIDVASGERRTLASAPGQRSHVAARWSPDGTFVVAVEEDHATPETVGGSRLVRLDVGTGERRVLAADWDRWAAPEAFSPDGRTLFVTADEDGHRPVFAIDLETDAVTRLTDAGAFSDVQVSPDGATLFAVRTAFDHPGEVVAVDVAQHTTRTVPSVTYPPLPGRLERVETTAADGTRVPGWLALPDDASADHPVPLTLWVHGGPVSSWNAWSWRWCPWLLVARGQAVLLPDPALSTGYGQAFVDRGWSRWGAEPYTDVMALTDAVEARPDVRDDASTMMGGSFGGYMANWIATQTDRFRAIVSHASLWDLRAFRATTDHPAFWRDGFRPAMLEEHNPARFADRITTPMLVIHGDKDYRVPVGEGLALWWALTGSDAGDPAEIPHRFLYFPDENHWVLTPQHAKLWYETVIEFLAAHREGRQPERPALL
ncbi:prolyl oligopeptidase family serine peptidase [uncultured Tessaracoccus sp.]|uniref:prolyl oligopeptidase family serine peptidase n=1 Tax=uncultured Tessaracoccus sp. TaxID=905023 RepID=UPI0025FB4130|nr:prolyl oligopeptidase family serine peptidase [uncultured Tessaracoccus sp.]